MPGSGPEDEVPPTEKRRGEEHSGLGLERLLAAVGLSLRPYRYGQQDREPIPESESRGPERRSRGGPGGAAPTPEELEGLKAATGRRLKTAVQAVKATAKMGGFLPYQKTPPGLKTPWLGWQYLRAMRAGYRLAKTGKPIL